MAPRQIIPGTTLMLTRRCFGRQFLLRPDRTINRIFKFCLAVAAARTGVLVHAYCVMSNHYHLIVTDVHGNLPEFMHWFNEYVAKCGNAHRGRWESFWAPGSYSLVTLVDWEDVVDKAAYVLANPISARLVRQLEQWPGAHSMPQELCGKTERIARPQGFFRANGPVPESVSLQLVPPPAFIGLLEESLAAVGERIEAFRSDAIAQARQDGQGFLGRRKVLAQSPFTRPKSFERRRGLNPRIASRDKWKRVEVLQRLKRFLAEYREAWERFAEGERSVIFPFGTYAMRVHLGVACAGP